MKGLTTGIVQVQIPASYLNPKQFFVGDLRKFLRLSTFHLLIHVCVYFVL